MFNIKQEIEKEFNQEANYKIILSKVERRNDMKNLKYVLVPVFSFAFIIAILIGVNYNNELKRPDSNIGKTEEKPVAINLKINKIKSEAVFQSDMDIKKIDGKIENINELSGKLAFMKEVKVPTDMKLTDNYYIYVRSNKETKQYDVLHDYIFYYTNNQKDNERTIRISFSEVGKPLRDYLLNVNDEISTIGDNEVVIQQYKEMYFASFEYNNIKFDIETNNISQDELVNILTSIIK